VATLNTPNHSQLVLPQFGSELFRTGLKFSSRFNGFVELDQKFSSGFRQGKGKVNLFKPGSNWFEPMSTAFIDKAFT
jgi:hypothetical protein